MPKNTPENTPMQNACHEFPPASPEVAKRVLEALARLCRWAAEKNAEPKR